MAKTGHPPKYATVEEMQAVIDRYFEDCKGEPIIGDDGMPKVKNRICRPLGSFVHVR